MLLQPLPPGFTDHQFEFQLPIEASEDQVWKWLNDPKTFTDNQIWPYRVEFYSPDPGLIPNGFYESVLTNHVGPFINFAGKLVSINKSYRDLQYFYGSYAINFNWFRPYRLEFWTSSKGQETILKGKLGTYVNPTMEGIWQRSQKIFWNRFKKWSLKSVRKIAVNTLS